ncbi:hypothetical protein H8E88_20905 [candidate division KSB1 bacterium]|nr:hypothetical protein [candidate division KSB1 bacterium]MBL7094839.1 hypothetical protein [candidate division KSB1 bacterium]
MFQKFFLQIFVLALLVGFSNLYASKNSLLKREETKQIQSEQNDSTDLKLKELEKLINDLKAKIEKKEKQDELKKLLEEASQLSTKAKEEKITVSKRFHSGARSQQKLNPNISLGGDFFAGFSSSKSDFVNEPSDVSYGNNRFEMREIEFSLLAPLDPFTRGKTFISITKEEIAIEEAYMEWLNLPLNMNLKAGIFYTEFGPLNRYHDHALPQFDRPRALVNYFTTGGLGGCGFSFNFMLPNLFFADASTFDFAVINGGNNFSFTNEGKYNLMTVGQFKNYYDLSRDTYLEFRLSGAAGRNDPDEKYNSYVGSLGMILKWVPVGRSKYRTVDWRTEFLYGYREGVLKDVSSKGSYSSLQYKLNARYWLTGRIGYSELPYDNTQSEWDFTACLDLWQSEFVFMRFQYQYNLRDINNMTIYSGKLPNDHSFIAQINWAMGPHKHEAY